MGSPATILFIRTVESRYQIFGQLMLLPSLHLVIVELLLT